MRESGKRILSHLATQVDDTLLRYFLPVSHMTVRFRRSSFMIADPFLMWPDETGHQTGPPRYLGSFAPRTSIRSIAGGLENRSGAWAMSALAMGPLR